MNDVDRSTSSDILADRMEFRKEVHEAHRAKLAALERAEIESGSSAVKAAMTINGGASITILAFIGSAIAKTDRSLEPFRTALPIALCLYTVGVLCAAAVFGIGWKINGMRVRQNYHRLLVLDHPYINESNESLDCGSRASTLASLAVGLLALSYSLFAISSFLAANAFNTFLNAKS